MRLLSSKKELKEKLQICTSWIFKIQHKWCLCYKFPLESSLLSERTIRITHSKVMSDHPAFVGSKNDDIIASRHACNGSTAFCGISFKKIYRENVMSSFHSKKWDDISKPNQSRVRQKYSQSSVMKTYQNAKLKPSKQGISRNPRVWPSGGWSGWELRSQVWTPTETKKTRWFFPSKEDRVTW